MLTARTFLGISAYLNRGCHDLLDNDRSGVVGDFREVAAMTHRPTQCDRSLFLGDNGKPLVIEHGAIVKAVSWYESSWMTISEALPIAIEGVTYTARWQEIFDYQTLPRWREGKHKHSWGVAYVYAALRRLFRGMRERASP